MVYNESVYSPDNLTKRLQAKFSARTAAFGKTPAASSGDNTAVMSFFGRTDDIKADRAIPKASVKNSSKGAGTAHAAPAVRSNVRPSAQSGRTSGRRAPAHAAVPTEQIAKSFSRAYAAGEGARNVAGRCQTAPRPNVKRRPVSEGALKNGRSNVPGSRHAVLVTNTETEKREGFFGGLIRSFGFGTRRAEHEMKKERIPFGLIAVLIVSTVLVMVLIYSFSRVQFYTQENGRLEARQEELAAEAQKLSLLLEEREDIRDIERIATDEIGMVRSDTVRSHFVSVSTPDRVEVMSYEDENGGGAAGILSAIGENLGILSDYFG